MTISCTYSPLTALAPLVFLWSQYRGTDKTAQVRMNERPNNRKADGIPSELSEQAIIVSLRSQLAEAIKTAKS
jgi:hypothetical protein